MKTKKVPKKEMLKFNKDVEKLVMKLKGERQAGIIYKWKIQTAAGDLLVNVHESDAGSSIFSIYCRFEEPQKAVEILGKENGRLNKFSGKFNYHEWTAEKALTTFYMDVEELTTEKILY